MFTGDDAEKDLAVVLSYLTGRKLTLDEVLAAVEMSRSTYYDRQAKGTLTSTDTLLRAAQNLGLNPVDLLIRYGRLEHSDVADYLQDGAHPLGLSTVTPTRMRAPAKKRREQPATIANLRPRKDAPPL
ncbi:hypothetical protein [Mycobacterium sp.]|jgi:hypothetical protein|uniref:hypothetical protein n=1 Tax=Mycobacterium sp. TaxID=1785 RepID=UPI002D54AF48|nr:hypothetical protein [Mycobacterium sp.]HZA12079.1 hypothetical protein [Mycobacterium sp.]